MFPQRSFGNNQPQQQQRPANPLPVVNPSDLYEGSDAEYIRGLPVEITGVVAGYTMPDYGNGPVLYAVLDVDGATGVKVRCQETFAHKGEVVCVRCDAVNSQQSRKTIPSLRYLGHRAATLSPAIEADLKDADEVPSTLSVNGQKVSLKPAPAEVASS